VHDGDRILFHHRTPTSTENAPRFNHPFENEDKSVHLIHNGIIANDMQLYDRLKGTHKFETLEGDKFTDSEVLLHLFDDEYAKDRNVVAALKRMSEQATGSFAVAIQRAGDKNIYLVRHSNPVVISKDSDDNIYFSSELDATNGNLTMLYEVGDSEIVRLSAKGYEKCATFSAPVVRWVYSYDTEKKSKKKHGDKTVYGYDDGSIADYDNGSAYGFSWKPKFGDWL
jgi:glucosamine--fructose-6-phosphate aminotransferase (isomerizing)